MRKILTTVEKEILKTATDTNGMVAIISEAIGQKRTADKARDLGNVALADALAAELAQSRRRTLEKRGGGMRLGWS